VGAKTYVVQRAMKEVPNGDTTKGDGTRDVQTNSRDFVKRTDNLVSHV
jgi:hypothetical protein